jgi:hypothetical protein
MFSGSSHSKTLVKNLGFKLGAIKGAHMLEYYDGKCPPV